jgi:hypothetical protein
LADRVDVVHTDNPFVLRELDVSAKVVQMPYQGAEDLSVSGFCLGGHKVNDMLCKVGVEFAIIVLDTIGAVGPVRSHYAAFSKPWEWRSLWSGFALEES